MLAVSASVAAVAAVAFRTGFRAAIRRSPDRRTERIERIDDRVAEMSNYRQVDGWLERIAQIYPKRMDHANR